MHKYRKIHSHRLTRNLEWIVHFLHTSSTFFYFTYIYRTCLLWIEIKTQKKRIESFIWSYSPVKWMWKEIKLNKNERQKINNNNSSWNRFNIHVHCLFEKPTAFKHTATKSNYTSVWRKHEKFMLCKTIYKNVYINW